MFLPIFMQAFLDSCRAAASFPRMRQALRVIVGSQRLHGRFINTLARLEYVGVRKMLKARRSEQLDLEGLQHVLEEAVHAVRLKKLALALDPAVRTFRAADTLAGDAAERYFQAVDAAAEAALGAPARGRQEAAYRLTSAAIEIRARCLYSEYQAALDEAGVRASVASILGDEEQHLEQMARALPVWLPDWQRALGQVMQREEERFLELLGTLLAAAGPARPLSPMGPAEAPPREPPRSEPPRP